MKFLVTIFVSSFLLFQIQPLLAKMALPFFGGGAAIWTACMLFFQIFLLLGYLYSHNLTKLNNLNHQVLIHSALIGISLLFLPVVPFTKTLLFETQSPQVNIILSLLVSIGFPYFMLSSTAPLIQKWYSNISRNNEPYRLYSLSNLGSLLALLSYPLLIEPNLSTQFQSYLWTSGYAIFAFFILLISYQLLGKKTAQISAHDLCVENSSSKGIGPLLLWLSFSAASVILMVSTTNLMTQNVPPTPFLWILPLCIYLLTYIICFNQDNWYIRKYWFTLFAGCSLAAVLMFYIGTQFNILTQVTVYSLILFFACMICHGELAKLKPGRNQLTLFYLTIAVGGVIGSIFTSVVAERLFNQYYEFPIAIMLTYILFTITLRKESTHNISVKSQAKQHLWLSFASVFGLVAFTLYFTKLNTLYYKNDVYNSRNFYGTLAVKDFTAKVPPRRMLFDGSTSHGTEIITEKAPKPTSYYRFNTGVSLALNHNGNTPKKVAVVGLGTGTLAAYGNDGDQYTFYELNPDVGAAANNHFRYLSSSKADVSVKIGDARISLQNEFNDKGSQQYQVLVVDAFSGDAIPVHLLTSEAFQLYWKHLTHDGLLVLHISNNHLDLLPLVATLAKTVNKQFLHFYSASKDENSHTTEWVVITNNTAFLENSDVRYKATYFSLSEEQHVLWTDDYSNLLSVIKF